MFEFSLTDAVRETIQSFAAVAASRDISLTTDIQNDLCYIGNEEMIRQLVSLLTDNALKYTDGDTVAVTLRAENGKRILETRNRASYMRDGSLNGVFERFARGDSSRNSQTGGQGIGLSVSKAIVEAHKGKIKGEQDHVHFDDGAALNKDGSWKHGQRELTQEERNYLQENGWTIE